MQIYIHRDNQQLGPFTEAEVKAQLAAGTISPQDHVWWEGQANWMPLGQSTLMASGSPPAPGLTPPMPAPAQVASSQQQTSGLAMASLVTGIVSTLTCGALFLPAIILGHMGLSATKKPEVQGRGLAVAGLVLGYVQLVLFGVVVLVFSAPILALIGLGAAMKEKVAQDQAQVQTTNSDQTTNAPAQSTPATTNSDQSTNSAPAATNSPDSSTNAAPSTNGPDSSTNAAPPSQ
jgi:hypothetical protein